MPPAPLPLNEAERLASLEASGLLDAVGDPVLADLVELAASIVGVPVALVSMIGKDHQRFIAELGLGCSGTPRDQAFCGYTILQDGPLVVPDAHRDSRFADNPLVTGEPGIRFYAGVPLVSAHGQVRGSLCVIDCKPRELMPDELRALRTLGRLVETRLASLEKALPEERRAVELRGIAAELSRTRAEAERLALIARKTVNAVLITDVDGRIEWANEGFTRLTGYVLEEVRGRTPGSFLQGPETDPETVRAMRERLAACEPVDVEILNYRKDGTPFWLQLQIQPLYDEMRRLTGFMALELEITERKRAAEALECALHDAEAASRAKSAFLANMSHEFRTPLTAILGFTELLLASEPDSINGEALRTIRRNADHLLSVLSDVLDLARMEAGQQPVAHRVCDPLEVVRRSAMQLAARAEEAGLGFEVDCALEEGGAPDTLAMTDPDRLGQIVHHLVSNAVKFTSRGRVRVRARLASTQNGQVRLRCEVSDTGPGIKPECASRLFDPFEQADMSASRRFGGTGLGLPISQRLARLLGGSIRLESTSASGSTFTLEAELDTPNEAAGEDPAPPVSIPMPISVAPKQPRDGNLRVLVAEDNADTRRLIVTMLERAGMTPEAVADGPAGVLAVERGLREGRPHQAVLVDADMPMGSGLEAVRAMRAGGYAGPMIAVTAYDQPGDRQACLEAGCDDCVVKPLLKDPFVRLVQCWLERGRSGGSSSACAA